MNSLARWKVVFALIAIFVAGVLSGTFLTSRTIKDAVRRSKEPRKASTLAIDRLERDLRLKPEQAERVKPVLRQIDAELANLRSLDLRETEGILSRGQDRINPILEPDQQQRLRQIVEERKQRLEQCFNVPESLD
jgi:uncharacterized protein YneF (UPF0154 family)